MLDLAKLVLCAYYVNVMNTHNVIHKFQNTLVKIVIVDSIPLEHCLLRRVDWDNDSKL